MDVEHQTAVAPHVNAADQSSGGAATVTPPHPSYGEMIRAAIEWGSSQGKEGGSSKEAISKYIDRVYSNLSLSHSALLTHHLNRMKKSGQLVMVKNSYELSYALSPSPQPPTTSLTPAKRGPGRPPKPKSDVSIYSGSGSGSEPTRKPRGRPPKLYQQGAVATEVPFVQPISEVIPSSVVNGEASSVGPKKRGRPPKLQSPPPGMAIIPFENPKRTPGRPRKYASSEVPVPLQSWPAEGSVRPVGRPRKNVLGPMVSKRPIGKRPVGRPRMTVLGPMVSKRPVGRPRMNVLGPMVSKRPVGKRPVGRPKKNVLGPKVSMRPVGKRPVGRPRKKGGAVSVGALGIGIGMGMRRRRGRPAKGGGPTMVRRRPSGLVGRPRKGASILDQEVANGELLRKFELFQSKIREAVIVIRPYIVDESPALTALKQLEDMATVDLTESPNAPPSPPVTMAIPKSTSPTPVVPISIIPASTASPTANVSNPFMAAPFTVNVSAPFHATPSGLETQHHPVSW